MLFLVYFYYTLYLKESICHKNNITIHNSRNINIKNTNLKSKLNLNIKIKILINIRIYLLIYSIFISKYKYSTRVLLD